MKKSVCVLILSILVFSCANNVAPNEYTEHSYASEQERAFLGYDLDKVYNSSINIKVRASNDDEMDAFVASLKDFDVVEMTRMEGFREGEMFVTVKANANYPKTLKRIRELSTIFYAEPNYKMDVIGTYVEKPSDTITSPFGLSNGNLKEDPVGNMKEYALRITEALRSYEELGYGDATVWAGIIDTGTNGNHEDLKYENGERVVQVLKTAFGGYYQNKIEDVSTGNSDTEYDAGGHGTHCTGSICAVGNNNKGIAGVAWKNVKFASYKGLQDGGGSAQSIYGSLRDLTDTVRRKVSQQEQATIPVNLSLGGPLSNNLAIEAINYALSKGVLVIAANGNDGQFLPSYPTACPGVFSVGASGDDDRKTGFSTSGSWLNVVAPGLNIISLEHTTGRDYVYMSGTSMATPFVTGVITYLLSFNPKLTPFQVVAILEKTADKIDSHNQDPSGKYDDNGFSNWYGYGRVNVYKAAKMVKDGNVPPPGEEYVETVLIVKAPFRNRPIHVYDKNTGVLVTMSVSYGSPAKAEIMGLRPGSYKVVCNNQMKEVTIGNDANVTVAF